MINIFEYENYRLYLHDYYEDQKKSKKYFSYRYFSKKAGINASAFLYYVIKGKRNLTKKSIAKISTAIGHSREEYEFFENMVFFNQAKTISEKVLYYTRIVECRKPVDIALVDKDRYDYYGKWYHSAIREIVTMVDFKEDYALIARSLVPAISAKEAQESVELLERLGFIEQDGKGLFHQTEPLISARPDSREAFVIEKFQMEMLQMALASFDRFPRSERLSSSTTFSISKATSDLFKMKTREFRKELLEIAKLDNEPQQVIQMTINLFPLSRGLDEQAR
jgi:uncharacterized protein (TIGR02147 family)